MIQACIYLKPRPSLPSPSPILTPCVLRSVTQPCPTLCHPLDCSPTDSSVHGIFNGNPFQYSCLENAIDRGARQATVHGIQRVGQDCAANFQFSLLFHYHKSSRETPPPTPGLNSLTSATRKKQDLVESPYMKCRSNERRGAAFSQALRTGSQGQLALPLHFTT